MIAASKAAPLWTAAAARTATGGVLHGDGEWTANGVSIDTRTLAPGDLFVALTDQRDGHEFVPAAFAAGAAAALVSRPSGAGPELVVDDVLAGLTDLAHAARERSSAIRIGVTGSVGKTGVKEALRTMLSAAGPAHGSDRSFNNHWGAPLSLARMPAGTKRAVFELGMNHAGELAALSDIVRPHIAAITRIAAAHMEYFNGLSAVAEAKSEIFSGLMENGVAVVPVETPYADVLAVRAGQAGGRVLTFGRGVGADVRVLDYEVDSSGGSGLIDLFGERFAFRVPVCGEHWADNAACALTCAVMAGVDTGVAIEALARFTPPPGRGGAFSVMLGEAEIVLIDDSYNANPASMAAAIAALGARAPARGGRRIAVLGDMLELGPEAPDYHAALADDLERAGVDLVIPAGPQMGALWDVLPTAQRAARAMDADQALNALRTTVRPGDIVLVKGSNASGMRRVAEALRGAA